MISKYNPKKIEPKWQKRWEQWKLAKVSEDPKKKKFYILDMFPYPSAQGLHVGHPEGYTATDIIARYKYMKGYSVLHPMGWDGFGLPTENYAIKTGIHPAIATKRNIARMKKQIKRFGFFYDWSREINTTDPDYYKWTQWIFLKLFKRGLAYQAKLPINWCPSCKTGLANEEVIGGRCERCKTKVKRKRIRQWVLKITKYAERLLKDLESLDWPKQILEMQRNWIGRSEGAVIKFPISNFQFPIEVFTTRPDTLFGATYLVLAPEHPIISKLKSQITNLKEVEKYIRKAEEKSDFERANLAKEKTGVELKGIKAINPATKKEIPVWCADYILVSYGTGAIMAVPAHDQRDFDFAKKYNLPIVEVVSPPKRKFIPGEEGGFESETKVKQAYLDEGILINSEQFNGLSSEKARQRITKWLIKNKLGRKEINYKLRDWIFSRQRYWGEPIPIIHCPKCGIVPVPEKDLPVKLPKVNRYQPTGTGESPLAAIKEWVNTKCPKCKSKAKRETNTMPQWAGSCWYYLRYCDPQNKKQIFDPKKMKYWTPVDLYVGGAEHAVLHLLYARFWHKVLYDEKIVDHKEPFIKLRNQGLILGEDHQKMSKSRGNVINPDEVVNKYGADTVRMYEMFMGPFEDVKPWSTEGILGIRRFLEKVWGIYQKFQPSNPKFRNSDFKTAELNKLLHKTIKKVTEDIENFKFNTAIASMMIFINHLQNQKRVPKKILETFLQLLSPFAPHICEELWSRLGYKKSIFKTKWPRYSKKLTEEEKIELVIQVNGKVRGKVRVEADIDQQKAEKLALQNKNVQQYVLGKQIKRVIFVPKKLINFVV